MNASACLRFCLFVVSLAASSLLSGKLLLADEDVTPSSEAAQASSGGVLVVRGLAGYWPDYEQFCHRVSAYGEEVIVGTPQHVSQLVSAAASKMQAGQWSQVRIVGYSYGADAAIETSRTLSRYGVTVERLILIEATSPRTVPGNVAYCFNIFAGRPHTDWLPAFRGVSVVPESEGTYLINYDVRYYWPELCRVGHFDFATDARIQSFVAHQAGAPSQGETDSENEPESKPDEVQAETTSETNSSVTSK
jgi:pimeloyl-ACP methyl ester carboxylesterase